MFREGEIDLLRRQLQKAEVKVQFINMTTMGILFLFLVGVVVFLWLLNVGEYSCVRIRGWWWWGKGWQSDWAAGARGAASVRSKQTISSVVAATNDVINLPICVAAIMSQCGHVLHESHFCFIDAAALSLVTSVLCLISAIIAFCLFTNPRKTRLVRFI